MKTFLGWTFAEDFLQSKTTHFALITVATAATAVLEHRLPTSSAFLGAVIAIAASLIRDSHAKYSTEIADLLYEGLHLAHLDTVFHEGDGEADAPTPETEAPPAPISSAEAQ